MADNTASQIMRSRRFLPLFITQFLLSFNDNMLKQALTIWVTYSLVIASSDATMLVVLATCCFMFPFVMFSGTAGKMADKYEKSFQIRCVKLIEVFVFMAAAIGFYFESISALMVVLFLMGTHSAFFSTLKYAILPEHLKPNELLSGNAFIEGSTFLAILLGTIVGATLIPLHGGPFWMSGVGFVLSILGMLSSFSIPKTSLQDPNIKISWNLWKDSLAVIKEVDRDYQVYLSIFAISWFWLISSVFVSQFPLFTKNMFRAEPGVATLFMVLFSIGIGIGSLTCERLLRGEVTVKYVPLGILGFSLFSTDLYLSTYTASIPAIGAPLQTLVQFLSAPSNWRCVIDSLGVAFCGGLYIVPLYATMQKRARPTHRSRTVAANNIVNSVFMFSGSLFVGLMSFLGLSIAQIFMILGIMNIAVALYVCRMLPEAVVKSFVCWALKLIYKVKVNGLEHYKQASPTSLIVANHVSFLDGIILAAFLPDRVMFALNWQIAHGWWWAKPFFSFVDTFPLDPANPMSLKSLIKEINSGHKCMIFPEGRITLTGSLMKIYEGPGLVADRCNSDIVPVRIDGAQYTPFSRLKGKVKTRLFPRITLTILPPCKFIVPEYIRGRDRRQIIGAKLYDLMSDLMFQSSEYKVTLFEALVDAKKRASGRYVVLEDTARKPMKYKALITKSFALGRYLNRMTSPQQKVGVFLPNAIGTVVTFMALQAFGRVPAMLNFSAGVRNVRAACHTTQIKIVLTSKLFIDKAKLRDYIDMFMDEGIHVLYMEDVKNSIPLSDKLLGLFAGTFPSAACQLALGDVKPEDPAVVMFTSGSEGTPKGVVLSHINLQSNRYQVCSKVDFNAQDVVFNTLPMFHAFGLSAGVIMPLLSGIKVFLYPSPLHYRVIPEMIYDTNATIMFGTDTFLSGYAEVAHPYDFYALRYVVAGAEKLKAETSSMWADKFGIRILEGYGATETSPVLSVNTPMQFKKGTVGRFMSDIRYRVQPVQGIEKGGRLFVSGPNIMMGYLLHDKPGELQPPQDGWYDTGDIVHIDEEGFITIVGRVKRFAKIGGEMVSLTAVEQYANACYPNDQHATASCPDQKKGEGIILFTTTKGFKRDVLRDYYKQEGISELALPKEIVEIDEIPLLNSGKVDYVSLDEEVNARTRA